MTRRAAWIPMLVCALALTGITAAAAAAATRTTTVRSANGKWGYHLVDGQRFTLYLFSIDGQNHSACGGRCAKVWHPLIARGRLVAGRGNGAIGSRVHQSHLHKFRRHDGRWQVTYYGHPLYLYTGDKKPLQYRGQAKSQFHGSWYEVSTAGSAITCKPNQQALQCY